MMSRLLASALAVLSLMVPALATGYYVSPAGDDTECNGLSTAAWDPFGGAGQTCAWATVNKCVSSTACGDTCNVAAGNYYEPEQSLSSKTCTAGNEWSLIGAGVSSTVLALNMAAIDTTACSLKSGSSVVYECPVPTNGDITSDTNLAITQDVDNNYVAWNGQSDVGGQMIDWVQLTWLTATTNLESTPGTAYYNSVTGKYEVHLWDDSAPAANKLAVSRSANDGFYLTGTTDYVTLKDFTVVSTRRGLVSTGGSTHVTLTNLNFYDGGVILVGGGDADSWAVSHVNIYNIVSRPNDETRTDCANPVPPADDNCWNGSGDSAYSTGFQGVQLTNSDLDWVEVYATRNGFTQTGGAHDNVIKHLKAHAGTNHNFLMQDSNVHDITIQDSAIWNGQETAFLACVYNITFEHVTFGDGGLGGPTSGQNTILIKGQTSAGCPAETPRNIDIYNSILNTGGFWFLEDGVDARANATTNDEDFDWDYNEYTTDTATSYKQRHVASDTSMTLSQWQAWSSDPSASPTRDPNSLSTQTLAQTHVNPTWHQDDVVTNPTDWSLVSGSVAIGLSDGVHNGTGIDLAGNTRSAPYDAGAYEYAPAAPCTGTNITTCQALDASGTYCLQNDVTAGASCFPVRASGVVLDLDGHTVTYGNDTFPPIPNNGFETCTGGVPPNWDLSGAPGAQCQAKTTFWGNYELALTFTGAGSQVIVSDPITWPADRTGAAFAFVKSPRSSDWEQKVEIWDNNGTPGTTTDDFIPNRCRFGKTGSTNPFTGACSHSITESRVNRGQATIGDDALEYKHTASADVYLKVTVTLNNVANLGDGVVYVDEPSILPAKMYGLACDDGDRDFRYPDMTTRPTNCGSLTIKSTTAGGKIVAGSQLGYLSPAVQVANVANTETVMIDGVTLESNGIQTDVGTFLYDHAPITIQNSTLTSHGYAATDRMTWTAITDFERGGGDITIQDSTLSGPPQMGIAIGRYVDEAETGDQVSILRNTIQHDERVTEGYGVTLIGVDGFEIANNQITPTKGRGILLDNSGGSGTAGSASVRNGSIHDNTITVQEERNPEYDEDGLMCTGIRIRQFDDEADDQDEIKNIDIYGNTITTSTTAGQVNRAFGIVPDIWHTASDIDIYSNTITATATESNQYAAGIVVQRHVSGGGLLFHDNTVSGNSYLLKTSDADGSSGVYDVTFEDNTYSKDATAFAGTYHFAAVGYYDDEDTGLVNLSGTFGTGVDPEDVINSGSQAHPRDWSQSWHCDVTVNDSGGSPVSGATVELRDKNSTLRDSCTTNASGQCRVDGPEWTRDDDDLDLAWTKTDWNEYTVSATSGADSTSQTVTLNQDLSPTLTLASGGSPGSKLRNVKLHNVRVK